MKQTMRTMTILANRIFLICILFSYSDILLAQSAMINVEGRNTRSLNGEWKTIIDPTGVGDWRQIWLERKPQKKFRNSKIRTY